MGQVAFDDENDVPIALLIQDAGISVYELWLYYFSIAGNVDQMGLEAYLHNLMPLPQLDCALLAQAVHEMRADITGNPWFRCRHHD